MNSDFELCFSCSNYGALHCKICQNNYCHEHLCEHLEENHRLYSNLSTPILRLKRDQIFQELKAIQAELDLREPQRQSNLNSYLETQGYSSEFYLRERDSNDLRNSSNLRKSNRKTNKPSRSNLQYPAQPSRFSVSEAMRALQHLSERDRVRLAENLKTLIKS